ncbi:Ig-like domain-containing protein [bacterium]|nr:Ig-like domain-containing protein [bacterium]
MKLRDQIILSAGLILALSSCGGGGGGGNPGPTPTDRLTLSGVVTDGSGSPLAGVQVLLSLNPTTTDASGRFSYGNLPAGGYTVSFEDQSGNYDSRRVSLSASSVDFSFSLPATDGLRVVSADPGLNSSGVPLDGLLTFEFSEAPLASSISAADFTFTPPVGDLELNLSGTTLTILPDEQLPVSQNMLIEYSGEIRNAANVMDQPLRLRFTTDSTDSYAPRLVGSRPADGSSGHPPNVSVSFDFNEPLDSQASAIDVVISPDTSVTTRVSGSSVLVSPVGGWQPNTDYSVRITGVRDKAGNENDTFSEIDFRTGDQALNARNREADWNLTKDTIVFSSNLGGSYDIYSVRPDGSELTQLTAFAGDERHPTLNYDGSLLAYQQRDDDGFWQVMLVSTADDQLSPVQLTSSGYENTEPYFSRTPSNDIVFVSTRQSVTGIWSVSADNLLETELDQSFGSGQYQPVYHPLIDGQLLFQSGRSGNGDIWRKTVSVISGEAININLTQQLLSDEHSPAWGPDASFFVFISDFDGTDNLWIGDAAGDLQNQLTFLDSALSEPVVDPVSANNRCLVTMEKGSAGSDLVLVDLTSGEVLSNLTGV